MKQFKVSQNGENIAVDFLFSQRTKSILWKIIFIPTFIATFIVSRNYEISRFWLVLSISVTSVLLAQGFPKFGKHFWVSPLFLCTILLLYEFYYILTTANDIELMFGSMLYCSKLYLICFVVASIILKIFKKWRIQNKV